jgi:ATP adenylyltransferase
MFLKMNFLISPALSKKPMLAKNDPGRSQSMGPFVDPDPNFVLGSVGPDHTLIFNKFCVSRPMFLLHTKEFQLQSDGLNESDFTAIWALLMSFKSPQMVLYNCGADSGASQGHKHLQLFPAPSPDNCVMFPEKLQLGCSKFVGCLQET